MKTKTTTARRALALCMSVLMLLTAWVFVAPTKAAAAADVWDGTWDGSGFSNNHITSAKGFAQFINNAGTGTSYSGQTVYLDVDIDLQSINFGNGGGKNVYYDRNNYFQGTFDGQGHTISNFYMTNDDHRVGLFRSAQNATFKNVNFENAFVDDNNNNGKNGFAVLVGWGDGNLTFENVHIKSGTVYGYNYVGGLVGEYQANSTLTLTNCSNGALIYADHDRAAGMVGHSKGSVVANGCSNTGEIYAGYSDAGGIAGWIEDDESSFVNCSNTGKVSTDACAGGIFGYFGSTSQDKRMTLTGCSNTGYIESRAKIAGGIGGFLETDNNAHQIKNNTNRGDVYGREDAGGIIGSNAGFGTWENDFNYGSVRCDNDNAGGILGEVSDDYQDFRNCYNTGKVTGKNSVGGILGYGQNQNHTFTNCGNSGEITATSDSAGGIYGYGNSSTPTIEECWNIGTIKGYNDAGGILGHTNYHSIIKRCWNAGSIETYNHDNSGAHGGIVGHTSDMSGSSNDNPNMTDCYNWGPVSGGWDDGGLIGKIKDGRTPYYITNSYNAGAVTGGRPFSIIAYGGNVGNNVYYNNNVAMGTAQGTGISENDLNNSSGFSGNYCKNTWGVSIGGRTYRFPILNWYRNLFMFHLKFQDAPSGTNVYWDGEYNSAFYAPNPTRRGYTTDHWFLTTDANKTIAIPTEIITCGVTPCTDSLLMTQSFSEVTDVSNDSTFNLNWQKIKQKLDMNAVLNGEYKFDNINFFTADVYVNGTKVADDVNDFYQDLEFEDTYEITDIKTADGYRFVGAYDGIHDGRQQSGLTGQMDIDLIEVAPEFKTLHTVTVTPGTGTTITGVESGTYAWGDKVTVTATAETGYDQSTPVLKVNGNVTASGSEITITGDTTITTDALQLNTYTVNFYNGDPDTPYASQTYTHGEALVAPENPTFSDGTDTDYRFVGWAAAAYPDDGWDTEVTLPETVTANANYYSLYDGYVTVTWKNGNETLAGPASAMVGTVPVYEGETPTTADAQYTYTAIGWNTDPDATTALDPLPELGTSNVTYYAVYDKNDPDHRTVNKYTITWKNWDGTVLDTDEVEYGETPVYSGPTPTRANDAQYTYGAYHWDPMIAAVSGEATYTAQFDYTVNAYTVTWKNWDGTVLETDEDVSYGTEPHFDGETPVRAADDENHYVFAGWDDASTVKSDKIITATFTPAAHVFDQQNTDAKYLKSGATCTDKAVYYYSCSCGCKGAETFESGETLAHDFSVLQSDADGHWYKCANCDATTAKEAHTGGTATCTEKAICSVCDIAYGDLLDHNFTVLQSDATDHWYKCVNCDATTEKEAHKGGTASCTEKAICEVCDAEYGELADHDFTVLQSDATDHWYKCANCDSTTEKAAHTGGTATCTEKAVCSVCDTAYGDLLDHDFTELKSDATDHWYKCANCDATTAKEAHTGGTATCTEKAKCEVCDTAYGELASHSYTELKSDADGHWYKCANCDATTAKEAHTGGTATCTEKAICSVCDIAYGDLLDHNFTVLQSDATDHWYKCVNCDATTEKEAHKGGTASCTEKAICEVCDAEYGELADHDFSVLQSDATDHWYKCANCDATTAKEAHKGGTATCTEKATCSVCSTVYGNFDYTNHSTDATVTKNEKAAGYTFKGYTGDIYCAACDHLKETGTEIDKLKLADNETVKSANEILAAEEAAPGTYDAEKIAALQQALTDLETLVNGTDEDAVLDKIDEIGEMLETIAPEVYVTVTFTVDGEPVSTQTIKAGADATAPEQAQYIIDGDSHKVFSGWTGDYTNVTADVTITAAYTTQDHTWTDGNVTKAATCMATGTQIQTCVCGATHEKTLEKDPANHTGNNTTTRENEHPATCTAAGSYVEVVTCECGTVISRTNKTAGNALGHSWGDWVITKNATCTEEGSKTRTCARDAAHTETQAIAKKAHVDNNGDGKCDVCGSNTDVHQHTDANGDNVCDNCGKTINTSFRCSMCDYNDQHRNTPVFGWFVIIVHFFVHLFAQMKAWV